jgi:hypothetical protein
MKNMEDYCAPGPKLVGPTRLGVALAKPTRAREWPSVAAMPGRWRPSRFWLASDEGHRGAG